MPDDEHPTPLPGERASSESEQERALAAALAEFCDLQGCEEDADIERFCALYPDLRPELEAGIKALLAVDALTVSPEMTPQWFAEPLPESLSGHKILREIGRGGMGRVLLAMDEGLGRTVAIKTLSGRFANDPSVKTRFMQEAKAMARLRHQNIVTIYNLGPADEPPHFVMEYLEGAPLNQAVQGMPLNQKIELLHKVVLAVEVLHQQHIIHRDLKPANILVGPDLNPKLLDFGLALQVDDKHRLTQAGEILGTPYYFSPEHTRAGAALDARSDVFSLGIILYELLTGTLPFQSDRFLEQVRVISELEPELPRRLDPGVPVDLQNVCMKALEKSPANRYATARLMADDLERFLAGEKVLASPSAYTSLMTGKVEQHLRELEGWRKDGIISETEFDSLHRSYGRLTEHEDAWIMQVRRLSFPQISLYLGAWILTVGAGLVFLFHYEGLRGIRAVLAVAAPAAAMLAIGLRLWKGDRKRIAVAYLLAFCLLMPVVLLVVTSHANAFTALTSGKESLEPFYQLGPEFRRVTNAQMWWSLLLSLPVFVWLRRYTRSSVFSLVLSTMLALLCGVTLLRAGLLEHFSEDHVWLYRRLIPIALIYFLVGYLLERRGAASDSRYFYPLGVVFAFAALSGIAAEDDELRQLLDLLPFTRSQQPYMFILAAGIYYQLHRICEGLNTHQMRVVAKAFRFVLPGHVLSSLLALGILATERWQENVEDLALRHEARLFEVLLPAAACVFVFASIPRQMKNFVASGLLFLAIGIIRIQQNYFKDDSGWPLFLLVAGLALMMYAVRYARIRVHLLRWLRRPPSS